MKTFGTRIKEARKAKGLSLDQVAKAVRSHKGYISGIENGKVRPPSRKIIPKLCLKLDLPLEELAALGYWEKRPKAVTPSAMLKLLEDAMTAEALTELPVADDTVKEAV